MPVPLTPTRDVLLEVARSLPPAAQILSGICELLHDVNTDLDQIAREIRMDAALAARVIRVSNSIVYGGGGSVSSVEEAVGRVGFAEVVRLVGTASVVRLVDRELQCYHVRTDELRESLLMHALASETLAEHIGLDRNTAYVGGLLRGLGMMVLDRFAAGRLAPDATYNPDEFATYQEWENTWFGVNSPRVTTMALDDWRFSDEIVSAIQLHLEPKEGGEEADRLAGVLNLAGAVATDHGNALPGEVVHWTRTPTKLGLVGIDETEYSTISERCGRLFEQQRQALY
jgi:HD-like signal output (HDOD) protein